MDGLVLILGIAIILIIGIPIAVGYGIYIFIKKKNLNKNFRWIALSPILIMGYIIYNAFYPSDEFYKEDFTEVTGLRFPESGKILYKTATFPDQFGDYTSVALIKVDADFYKSLSGRLSEKGFREVNDLILLDKKTLKKYSDGYVKIVYNKSPTGKSYSVGLVSDNELLIIERSSW